MMSIKLFKINTISFFFGIFISGFFSLCGQEYRENQQINSLYDFFGISTIFRNLPVELQTQVVKQIILENHQFFFPICDSEVQKTSKMKILEILVPDKLQESNGGTLINNYKKLSLITGATRIDKNNLLISGTTEDDAQNLQASNVYKVSLGELLKDNEEYIKAEVTSLNGDLVNAPIQTEANNLILLDRDKTTEIYDFDKNDLKGKFVNPEKIYDVKYNSIRLNAQNDKLIVSGNFGNSFLYFGDRFGQSIELNHKNNNDEHEVKDSDVSPSGIYAITSGYNRKMGLWSLPDGQLVKFVIPSIQDLDVNAPLDFAKFIDDNHIIAPENNLSFAIYNLPDFKIIRRFEGHKAPVLRIGLDVKNNIVVSIDENLFVVVWQLSTAIPLAIIKLPKDLPWFEHQIFVSNELAFIGAKTNSKFRANNQLYIAKMKPDAIGYLKLLKNGYLKLDQILFIIFADLLMKSCKLEQEQLSKIPETLMDNMCLAYNSLDETVKKFIDSKYFSLITKINNLK